MFKKTIAAFMAAAMLLSGCAEIATVDTSVTSSKSTDIIVTPEITKSESVPAASADPGTLPVDETTPAQVLPEPVTEPEETKEPLPPLSAEQQAIASAKTLPVVYVTTEGMQPVTSKEFYVNSNIEVFNCSEDLRLKATGGIRVRGNSTSDLDGNPPYRIKFDEKHNMLGLHDGKKYKSWVLLRTWTTLIPDYMAFALAGLIFEDQYYSSDCTLVNVYLNGAHQGVYLLCEQNQVAKDRIDVKEPKEGDTSVNVGYSLEMDNYPSDEHPYFLMNHLASPLTDMTGVTKNTKGNYYSIKSDTYSPEQVAFIEKYLNSVYYILYNAAMNNTAYRLDDQMNTVAAPDMTPKDAVCAVIDVNSVANMVILEELTHNYDVGTGSFYMAVDFSGNNDKYQKLTFDAPWDFNWAYQDSTEGYYASTFQINPYGGNSSNMWLVTFMSMDWFRNIVKTKWRNLESNQAIENFLRLLSETLPTLVSDAGAPANTAQAVVNYVNGRIAWLNTVW